MSSNQGVNREVIQDFEGGNASQYWRRFTALLSISVVVATVGLYRDSGAVVIAAMLIAPLMTPIMGIATAIVRGRSLRMLYLLTSVVLAGAGTVGLSFLILFLSNAPSGRVLSEEVIGRTDPGLEELLVALAAGIAGAYVQMSKRDADLLPGVAIGVSLVPPLSAAGILLYFDSPNLALEAVLLFVTNLVAIILAASATFFALGMRPMLKDKNQVAGFGLGAIATFTAASFLAVELGSVTLQRFAEARQEQELSAAIVEWAGDNTVEIAQLDVSRTDDPKTVVLWLIIDVPAKFDAERLAPAEMISERLDGDELKQVITSVVGTNTLLNFRMQIRYGETLDLKTGKVITR